MNKKECYEILEVPIGANQEEIKKAYRKLAMEWHPDRNKDPEAEKKMSKINEAYQILSTPPQEFNFFNPFDMFRTWNASNFSTTRLIINIENQNDANIIIDLIKKAGINIKGYSVEMSNRG